MQTIKTEVESAMSKIEAILSYALDRNQNLLKGLPKQMATSGKAKGGLGGAWPPLCLVNLFNVHKKLTCN
uniref:Uncharacterized protein n=1 Tax=Arundo donax TaxID=35708 RepID=A0A0A9F5I8_ARUDO